MASLRQPSTESCLPASRPHFWTGVFAALDCLLDEARSGPTYLRQPAIADLVVEAIYYSATVLNRYTLHAFVVMPNHVHMLVSPHVPMPEVIKTLKSFTAKRANQSLGLTGNRFWQEESYDHLVRSQHEVERIRLYIEHNPVRAGLVREATTIVGQARAGQTFRSADGARKKRPGGRLRTWRSAPPFSRRKT